MEIGMRAFLLRGLLSLAVVASGAALAQGGPGSGAGPRGGGPNASAPGPGAGPGTGPGMMGRGPGSGPGAGGGPGARWGSDYTPGWSMMTSQERQEHQARMRSMNSYEECNAYMTQHREQMAQRAQERGGKPLPQPRRDPCAGLKR